MPCEANLFWLGDDNDDGEAFQPMDREALAQQNASRARPAAGASSASSASSLSVAQKTARKIGKPDEVFRCPFTVSFSGGRVPLLKCDRKKATLILTSLLENLVAFLSLPHSYSIRR